MNVNHLTSAVAAIALIISIGVVGYAHPNAYFQASTYRPVEGEVFTLDASESRKGHDAYLTYVWHVSYNGRAWFNFDSGTDPTTLQRFDKEGHYGFTLVVTDGHGHSDDYTRTIYVVSKPTPVVQRSSSTYLVLNFGELHPVVQAVIAGVVIAVAIIEYRKQNRDRYDIQQLYRPIPA